MKLYRVENPNNSLGLWYQTDTQALSQVAKALNLSGKDLPMEFDEQIAREAWRSAADSIEQLKYWFTHEDLQKLIPIGYKLFELETDVVKMNTTEFYSHPLFQDSRVQQKIILDIDILLK